jgi:hypothetical protein
MFNFQLIMLTFLNNYGVCKSCSEVILIYFCLSCSQQSECDITFRTCTARRVLLLVEWHCPYIQSKGGGEGGVRGCMQKFPYWVDNEIYTYNNKHLTHKIVIQLHVVAESCTICSSRSGRPVRKLLYTPSYTWLNADLLRWKCATNPSVHPSVCSTNSATGLFRLRDVGRAFVVVRLVGKRHNS